MVGPIKIENENKKTRYFHIVFRFKPFIKLEKRVVQCFLSRTEVQPKLIRNNVIIILIINYIKINKLNVQNLAILIKIIIFKKIIYIYIYIYLD